MGESRVKRGPALPTPPSREGYVIDREKRKGHGGKTSQKREETWKTITNLEKGGDTALVTSEIYPVRKGSGTQRATMIFSEAS